MLGLARRFELAVQEGAIRELAVPMTPKFQPPRLQSGRKFSLPGPARERRCCSVDNRRLRLRREKANSKSHLWSQAGDLRFDVQFEKGTIQFLISVEANRVEVRSSSCEHADSYDSPQRDLTKGKIGIKSGPMFVIRPVE